MTEPLPTGVISYKLTITRVADGATAEVHEHTDPEYRESTEFVWSEGNFACDCNRAAVFARARNEDTVHPIDLPCGNDAFHIEKLIWFDGVEETVDGPLKKEMLGIPAPDCGVQVNIVPQNAWVPEGFEDAARELMGPDVKIHVIKETP